MLDARRLQTNLGVPVDGIIGVGTLTALFAPRAGNRGAG